MSTDRSTTSLLQCQCRVKMAWAWLTTLSVKYPEAMKRIAATF